MIISYSITPRAHTSVWASTSASPAACSGDMYAGVPMATPVCVRKRSPGWVPSTRAMPKSITLGTKRPSAPRVRKMFPGLRSRCTMRSRWASAIADSTGARIAMASPTDIR